MMMEYTKNNKRAKGDYMRGNKMVYGVYERNEEEECRFIGTAEEIASEFKTTIPFIRNCVSNNLVFFKKYTIKSLYKIKEERGIE